MIELTVEQDALRRLAKALQAEEDSKQLRRELVTNLRAAVQPAIPEIKAGLARMSSRANVQPALWTTVANAVSVRTSMSGRRAGVRVSIPKKGMPRGFRNAPQRLNREAGWRHPVFGDTEQWVQQIGSPGYFDRPLEQRKDEMRAAAVRAVEEMSERIARTASRG